MTLDTVHIASDDRIAIADALETFAAIDEGENTDTDELRRLAEIMRGPDREVADRTAASGMVKDPLGTQDWPVAEGEDVVPPFLRDLIGPRNTEELHRRRVALIGEVVKLRMEAQQMRRPLSPAAWEALEEAEERLYRPGDGLNGWTDVVENDGNSTLTAVWDQAQTYVTVDAEQFPDPLREIAERTAAALSILAFGVGATDLSRLDAPTDRV